MKFLHKSNLFLILDWYHDYSIKTIASDVRRSHNSSLSTPLPPKEATVQLTETKKQLIELLAEWLLRVFTNAPDEKKLVITSQSECTAQAHLGFKTLRHGMSTTHEETKVIIPQQVRTAKEEITTCEKVVSTDTDVFVLLLYLYTEQSQAVIEISLTSEKQLRNTDVAPYLLAAHALSECDRVLKSFGLGKKSVCSLLQKYPLQHLGEANADISAAIQGEKMFIAAYYGITSTTDISKIRCIF